MKTKDELVALLIEATEALNKKNIELQVARSSKGSEAEVKILTIDVSYQKGLIDGLTQAIDEDVAWTLQGDLDDMSQDYRNYVELSSRFGNTTHLGPMGVQWMKKYEELKHKEANGELQSS